MSGSSWDVVIKFCFEQANLTDPAASTVRNSGARAALWLSVLRDARTGWLQPGWRQDLPTFDQTRNVAVTTAAMDLAAHTYAWEPFAAGEGGLHSAANAWYQGATVMLFDAVFMQTDAIAEGRAPDDHWHRVVLPVALRQAVYTTQTAFNTAILDVAARVEFVAQLGPIEWADDRALFAPAPRSWNTSAIGPRLDPEGVRPAFFEAMRGYLTD